MEHSFKIDDFYLPLDTLKRVPIGTILLDTEAETEYLYKMLTSFFKAIYDSEFHEDAISFCFHISEGIIVLYKRVPLLDVDKHLEPN
jgi:hypothetical protein